jgi:putative ABC transport system permease protein
MPTSITPSGSRRPRPRPAAKKSGKPAKGGGGARKSEFVNLTVIDAIPGYVTVPTDYSQSMIEALRRPYAVAVDETALKRLGVKKGDKALYNGKTVYVANWFTNEFWSIAADSLKVIAKAKTGDGPRAFGAFIRAMN